MRLGFFITFKNPNQIIMKPFYPLFFVLFVSISSFSQRANDTLTLNKQFDRIYRISTSYLEYKVIKKDFFQELKKNVSDSLNTLKQQNKAKDKLIQSQKDSISDIKKIASTFEGDLNQTIAQKNSIKFLGISFSKPLYNIIVWGLIGLLLTLLIYYIYRFNNSNIVTSESKSNLINLEEEFAIHKKKSLEREQKLRRQLQDEINKQRGV